MMRQCWECRDIEEMQKQAKLREKMLLVLNLFRTNYVVMQQELKALETVSFI